MPDSWACRLCAHRNADEDGPVCENCGVDNSREGDVAATEYQCIECGQPSDLSLNPSGLWCTTHEHERRARITAQMATVTRAFEKDQRP